MKSSFEILFDIAAKRSIMLFRDRRYYPALEELSRKGFISGFNSCREYQLISMTCRGDRFVRSVEELDKSDKE